MCCCPSAVVNLFEPGSTGTVSPYWTPGLSCDGYGDSLGAMKRGFQVLAVIIWLAGLALWLAGGRNLGWTRTQEQVPLIDEVTGIEGSEWRKVFRPGVEFLGAVVVTGAVFWGVGWIWGRKRSRP